jgi:hypothetical protein
MRTAWKLFVSLVAITALALMATATVPAANPNAGYTCIKETQNGHDVVVGVPEAAVPGLTNAGFTCVPNAGEDENEDPGDEGPGNEDPGGHSGSAPSSSVEVSVPQESRSLYCSTNGLAYRANGDGMGVALNLLDSQGALMVEMGLVTPANFYQGIGASCDLLAGFRYSDVWVDHMGDVVPGVALVATSPSQHRPRRRSRSCSRSSSALTPTPSPLAYEMKFSAAGVGLKMPGSSSTRRSRRECGGTSSATNPV